MAASRGKNPVFRTTALGDLFEGRSMHFPFRSRALHRLATRISRV